MTPELYCVIKFLKTEVPQSYSNITKQSSTAGEETKAGLSVLIGNYLYYILLGEWTKFHYNVFSVFSCAYNREDKNIKIVLYIYVYIKHTYIVIINKCIIHKRIGTLLIKVIAFKKIVKNWVDYRITFCVYLYVF